MATPRVTGRSTALSIRHPAVSATGESEHASTAQPSQCRVCHGCIQHVCQMMRSDAGLLSSRRSNALCCSDRPVSSYLPRDCRGGKLPLSTGDARCWQMMRHPERYDTAGPRLGITGRVAGDAGRAVSSLRCASAWLAVGNCPAAARAASWAEPGPTLRRASASLTGGANVMRMPSGAPAPEPKWLSAWMSWIQA